MQFAFGSAGGLCRRCSSQPDKPTGDKIAGATPDAPPIGSLAKVYGTVTFILEHPAEVDAYLKDQERIFEEIKARHPMPPEMIERFERPRERKAG